MIAIKYNENMTYEEFKNGVKSVFAMSAHYGKLKYDSVGLRDSASIMADYMDANEAWFDKVCVEL